MHATSNITELTILSSLISPCVKQVDGPITEDDLPESLRAAGAPVALAVPSLPSGGLALRNVVDDIESDLILQALAQTQWNKNRAAQLLGLNRTTLIEKIKKKGLKPPPPPSDLASED